MKPFIGSAIYAVMDGKQRLTIEPMVEDALVARINRLFLEKTIWKPFAQILQKNGIQHGITRSHPAMSCPPLTRRSGGFALADTNIRQHQIIELKH